MGSMKVEMLQEGISSRQAELQRVADVLARSAYQIKRRGTVIRVMLIILGSVVAAQTTFGQLDVVSPKVLTFVFLIFGIAIAALAGIETAFKYESRGSELNSLAATCHSTVRLTDASWYKKVGIREDENEKVVGALELIELQDVKLSEVQEKAAMNGLNIALEVRKHYLAPLTGGKPGSDGSDDDFTEPRMPPPYAA
jgi:hypothetical protein